MTFLPSSSISREKVIVAEAGPPPHIPGPHPATLRTADLDDGNRRIVTPVLPFFQSPPIDIGDVEWGRKLIENSEQTRRRRRASILASADSVVQRSASVLPGLLPRGILPMRPFRSQNL